jgi:hypothetical protein
VLFVFRRVNGAYVQNPLLGCVSYPSVGQRYDCKDDQNNSRDACCFHLGSPIKLFVPLTVVRSPTRAMFTNGGRVVNRPNNVQVEPQRCITSEEVMIVSRSSEGALCEIKITSCLSRPTRLTIRLRSIEGNGTSMPKVFANVGGGILQARGMPGARGCPRIWKNIGSNAARSACLLQSGTKAVGGRASAADT